MRNYFINFRDLNEKFITFRFKKFQADFAYKL